MLLFFSGGFGGSGGENRFGEVLMGPCDDVYADNLAAEPASIAALTLATSPVTYAET